MPTLDWIGKDAVVKHHKEVPYRLLEPVSELSHGDADSGNLIVQGDNLHALKALLPRYAGKVKCIYIDPPYNTGNEGWVYNDNVNSPEIRKWLHETVGREGEDLSRHDKWLCMMYPRLLLLRRFLRRDGVIAVSIDDDELGHLRLLMDEIFGRANFIANIVWQKRYVSNVTAKYLSDMHDHLLVYGLHAPSVSTNLVPRTDDQKKDYKNPDNDSRGVWRAQDLSASKPYQAGLFEIVGPTGKRFSPPPRRYWRMNEEQYFKWLHDDRIWFGVDGTARPMLKRFLTEVQEGVTPNTWWHYGFAGHNKESTLELKELFGGEAPFNNPKPVKLLQRYLQIFSDDDCLVLDSFSGSGTTAHAVLKQNAEEGGNRKFILVEMEEDIAHNITAERIKRVAHGYTNAKGKKVEGFGGGFQYCKLSEQPLFNANGAIREDVTFTQLAEFVWFAETGSGFVGKADSPLIGVDEEGRGIYLLYNGILKDKSVNGGNVLTSKTLAALPPHDGPKIIYAAACRLGRKRLEQQGIVFKQTPYALEF